MLPKQVGNAISSKLVDAIIVCGGTGLRVSEITLECLRPLMVKTMPGFAEVFRKLSYDKFGSQAITSRALAGITDQKKALFCIPKSLGSIKLVLTKLILPEIDHILQKAQDH
jgi:molybdenum cofactor biosynthesis protein B